MKISELCPGDKVRIVDKWGRGCHPNPDGRMDHWLDQIMTVQEVVNTQLYVHMVEDLGEQGRGGWTWYGPAIACKVGGESYDIDDLSCLFE